MKTAYAVIVPFGLASLLSTLCMYASPHGAFLILDVVTFGTLLISLVLSAVLGFRWWRRSSAYWMLPAIVCFTFLTINLFTPAAGRRLADRQFKKHLPEYEEVVAEIRNAEDFQSAAIKVVKTKRLEYLNHNIRAITGMRCEDGSVVVAFVLNTPVVLLHDGYVYKGGDTATCKREDLPENRWPYLRPVTGNWYHFSDQPGL